MESQLYTYLRSRRFFLSHREFASKIGLAPTNLSRILNGHTLPGVALAKKIEKATDGEIKWHEIIDDAQKCINERKK